MTSSESEGHSPPKKRGRTSNSVDDAAGAVTKRNKKARGRPRVDTHDATAADRRRTQIRLAQRAYRQRKETTISSLKRQSSQLHSIIGQMNKNFVHFNDTALKSGLLQLNPVLARELKHTNETFSALAKTATECEAGDDDQVDFEEQDLKTTTSRQSLGSAESTVIDIGLGYTTTGSSTHLQEASPQTAAQTHYYPMNNQGSYAPSNNSNIISRRQFILGGAIDHSGDAQRSSHDQLNQSQPLPFGLVDLLSPQHTTFPSTNPHTFPVNIPTPNVTPPLPDLSSPPYQLPSLLSSKTLEPVFTYSHDETTFARRLARAALEAGFHLLSSADIRPTALNYVFRLSLPFLTIEQLRSRFKRILSRSVHEDLDFWETPFIHLGGAGTHYPRRDGEGNIMRTKNSWIIRQIGPFEKRLARVVNVVDGQWQDLDGLDLGGFEGEWFDSHDVQGYLEEKFSCTIDPKSSFAECVIEEEQPGSPPVGQHWREELPRQSVRLRSQDSNDARGIVDPPHLLHSNTDSSTTSSIEGMTPPPSAFNAPETTLGLEVPYNNGYPGTHYSKFDHPELSFDQTLGLDLAPGYDYGYTIAPNFSTDMTLGLDLMGEIESLPVVKQKQKKCAWVDVTKLIEEVIKHAVCLGRAPGFRRKDIDVAMRRAVIPAF